MTKEVIITVSNKQYRLEHVVYKSGCIECVGYNDVGMCATLIQHCGTTCDKAFKEYTTADLEKEATVRQFSIDVQEAENYLNFVKNHKCIIDKKVAIAENLVTSMTSIIMLDTSNGINVFAECRACGAKLCLNSDARNNSF